MQPVRGMAHKQQQQSAGRVLITASSISGRPSNAVGKWQRREEASTFVLSRYRCAYTVSVICSHLDARLALPCPPPPAPRFTAGSTCLLAHPQPCDSPAGSRQR